MTLKSNIETSFAQSGAADCETMEKVYASKIEAQKTDLEFLKTTLTLFQRVGCTETEAYFAAANYAHQIQPTYESAFGQAGAAIKKKDNATAEKYLLEALELTSDDSQKSTINYAIATMAFGGNNYQKARTFAQRALDGNPNNGKAMIIIGLAYGNTAQSVYPNDAVLRKMVYVLAVDKFERARQLDPSCADDANRYANQYRNQFPTTEEVFMHPDLTEGSPFTVGGWINERTTVRVRR
jgi:tetratricopeptide (TPR) repeat protein